jgi:hypothetical protein
LDKNPCSFAFLAGAFCAALSTAGCTTHQCDSTSVTLGADAGGTGFWTSYCGGSTGNCQIIWSSSDTMNSSWTDYPGNATLTFTFPPLPTLPAGLTPDFADITFGGYVAAGAPTADANTFNVTPASGQLLESVSWSSSSISVLNATCQEYRLLLQVTVPVLAPDGGLPDDDGVEGDSSNASFEAGNADAQGDSTIGE